MAGKFYTQEQFIEKAKQAHYDFYDYSKVEYVSSRTKIKIICPIHGIFEQLPSNHLQGQGCKKCYINRQALTTNEFIEKAKQIHGNKYDYSLVEYINSSTKITIICPKHGEFEQKPIKHLSGQGCLKCFYLDKRDSQEQFINKANLVHNNFYDYSKIKYINSKSKVCIICPKHGEFLQEPSNHIRGKGCPICNISKGELKIRSWLENNNIKFEEQKTFTDLYLTNKKNKLRFDFFLPDYNLCIEYDGQQHFVPHSFNLDQSEALKQLNLDSLKKRDSFKSKYCQDNNIKLLRIPYWKQNNIDKILSNMLVLYKKQDFPGDNPIC